MKTKSCREFLGFYHPLTMVTIQN